MSLIMCDIDSYKQYNDTYGHIKGDECLKSISKVLLKNRRATDTVTRYGGDEFLCGIANVSKKTVIELAEKIIYKIDKLNIYYDSNGGKVSISIGILELNYKEDLRDYFLELDKNLYKAKNSTTNKIVIS